MKSKILILLSILFSQLIIAADDYSIFFVPLENINNKVYLEKTSKYYIKSTNEILLPHTSCQQILKNTWSGNNFVSLLRCGLIEQSNKDKNPHENYLSNSRLLNLDDPEILKLKPQFQDSKDIIFDVEKFVFNLISNKKMGVPIISAAEIMKSKAGDCTEHTVLAVSLLRSLGIPSRAIVGMILAEEFEGARNVFVYHMWAEAYINGRWTLVDATRPGLKQLNRYIAFAFHHLQTEMPLSYLKAVVAMKSFTVEYAE